MTDRQERPARRHAPPTAVPPSRRENPPEPASASAYVPRHRPRRSLLSVLLVGVVIVVLSLLLGSLGEVSWPWEGGTALSR